MSSYEWQFQQMQRRPRHPRVRRRLAQARHRALAVRPDRRGAGVDRRHRGRARRRRSTRPPRSCGSTRTASAACGTSRSRPTCTCAPTTTRTTSAGRSPAGAGYARVNRCTGRGIQQPSLEVYADGEMRVVPRARRRLGEQLPRLGPSLAALAAHRRGPAVVERRGGGRRAALRARRVREQRGRRRRCAPGKGGVDARVARPPARRTGRGVPARRDPRAHRGRPRRSRHAHERVGAGAARHRAVRRLGDPADDGRRARAARRDHGARHLPGAGGDALRVGPGRCGRGDRRVTDPTATCSASASPRCASSRSGAWRRSSVGISTMFEVPDSMSDEDAAALHDPRAHRVARGAPAGEDPGGRDGRGDAAPPAASARRSCSCASPRACEVIAVVGGARRRPRVVAELGAAGASTTRRATSSTAIRAAHRRPGRRRDRRSGAG